MFTLVVLILIAALAYWLISRTVENHQHWNHMYDGALYSAEDFYQSVQEAVARRAIPDLKFSRAIYSQGGMLSGNREYLHIEKDEFIYDVCAAPYGKGFFVSMWYVERPSVTKKLMRRFKALEPLADRKTYYQADTDAMIKSAILCGFMEAVQELENTKGLRALADNEMPKFI